MFQTALTQTKTGATKLKIVRTITKVHRHKSAAEQSEMDL
jgi:hypothetical protein